MNRTTLVRTLGQKPVKACKMCGDFIPAFSEVMDFAMGGQPRCTCMNCVGGNFRNGRANGSKLNKVADVKVGKNIHTIMVYTWDEAVVLNACVAHDMSVKKLASGCYRLKITVKSCNKGGWLFDETANIQSEGCGIVVNGVPVKDAHEYHAVVGAQDWYKRVGE